MDKNNYVVIMAGGIGSRFWPASRTALPKQFLDILGTGKSLIQQTFDRFLKFIPRENIYIATNEDCVDLVKEHIKGIDDQQILPEPARKNTAPCVAYAAYKIEKINSKANIIVAPSDHIILDEDEYIRIATKALEFVDENEVLATMGILPTRPDTGYGYIQFSDHEPVVGINKVKTFTEKPSKEVAETFVESGDFLWNAGIFVWNVKTIIKAFESFLPEISDAFEEIKKKLGTTNEIEAVSEAFALCPNISIDFGVMEKASNVFVLPSNFGWSDLGTWASLFAEKEKDYLNNAVNGKHVMIYDAGNNMINVPDHKMVVIQGLENFIVVDTEDVLLICSKDEEQKIKEITNDIKRQKGSNYL